MPATAPMTMLAMAPALILVPEPPGLALDVLEVLPLVVGLLLVGDAVPVVSTGAEDGVEEENVVEV
jgi:hypothetical protein